MAEAWARQLLPPSCQIHSAGVEKHGLNPHMLTVMAEAGCDMASHFSKTIDELPPLHWDLVITVCDHAAARCPVLPAARNLHLPFDDPPALTRGLTPAEALPTYRRVRDEIHTALATLTATLSP